MDADQVEECITVGRQIDNMTTAHSESRFDTLPTWKRRIVLLLVFVVVVAFLTALAEGAVRIRAWVNFGNIKRIEDTYVFDETFQMRVLRPGWTNGRITVNSQGFRSPEISQPGDGGTLRIGFLGASTTYCAEVSSDSMTWPHIVVDELRARLPQVEFEYINAGVPGYSVSDSLKMLMHRVARFDPDLIVIYHATNDLSFNSFEEARTQGVVEHRAEEGLSWLSQHSLLWYLVEKNLTIMRLQAAAAELEGKIELVPDRVASPFRSDLRELVDASDDVSPLVALLTFSTQLRPEQSAEDQKRAATTSLYYMPYMSIDDLLVAFGAYNDVIREVAEETGAMLIDRELSIPGDPANFVDSVHFTDVGSRAMAARVADGLLTSDRLLELVETIAKE